MKYSKSHLHNTYNLSYLQREIEMSANTTHRYQRVEIDSIFTYTDTSISSLCRRSFHNQLSLKQ